MSVREIASRIANTVKRAIIERLDDSEGVQAAQVTMLDGEVQDGVEHLQPYGLSFRPPAGSEGVALAIQGAGSNRVLLGAAKRGDRPQGVEEGEGGLYSLGSWRLFIDADGIVYIGQDATQADDPVACSSVVDARLDALEEKLNDVITAHNTHTHVAPMGGTTPPSMTETPVTPGESTASSTMKVQR